MVSALFFFLIFLTSSSMAFKNDVKFPDHNLNRISRNTEQQRALRNLLGKLIDTETNTIYSLDGQKQHGSPPNTGTMAAGMSSIPSVKFLEDLACLEACYKCVEDYPLVLVGYFFFLIDLRSLLII